MKRRGITKLVAFVLLFTLSIGMGLTAVQKVSASSTAENGTYRIPVALWNAAKDQESMGNASLEQEAKLVIKNGKATLYLKFQSMVFSGMEGYLSQFDLLDEITFGSNQYPEKYELVPSTVVSTFAIVDQYNSSTSTDINVAGKKYPKVVSIGLTPGDDLMWAQVYVPIMGSLGFGNQLCRIKLDYENMAAMTEDEITQWKEYEQSEKEETTENDTNNTVDKTKLKSELEKAEAYLLKTENYTESSLKALSTAVSEARKVYALSTATQIIIDNQVKTLQTAISELVEKSTENLDKENLQDGKYSVYVDIWHATSNEASMGNPALNKKALLTVKNGKYSMELSTRPMVIGTITACLQSMQIKQANGSYVYAEITARNNENNQPSIFQFNLPSKEEYLDILIDPKVEVMGDDPIGARLKISWDSLTRVSDDEIIEENTDTIVSGEASDAVNIVDGNTGIQLKAEANILETGSSFSAKQLTSGAKYKAMLAIAEDGYKTIVYKVEILNAKGETIQPKGMVQISIPIPDDWEAESIYAYRLYDNATTKMSGTVMDGQFVFSTNKIGTFALFGETTSDGKTENGQTILPNIPSISNPSTGDSGSAEEEESEETEESEEVDETTENDSKEKIQLIQQFITNATDNTGTMIALVMVGISMFASIIMMSVVMIVGMKTISKRG